MHASDELEADLFEFCVLHCYMRFVQKYMLLDRFFELQRDSLMQNRKL